MNNHQSPFIGPMKIDKTNEKLLPLNHDGPEMKFTFFSIIVEKEK